MPTETIKVGADDVTENVTDSTLDSTGNDITLGIIGEMEYAVYYDGGFRFQDVSIPTGATIDSATLSLYNSSSGQGLPVVVIKVDDVANAAAWSGSDRPSQITPFGSASLDLDEDEIGDPGAEWTADVTSQVQNIVDKSAWAEDNAIRFWADSSGSNEEEYRTCGTYENGTKATIAITYSYPPKDISLLWNTQAIATSDLGVVWNTQAVISNDLALSWNVYINIDAPKDLQLSWGVLKSVGKELQTLWTIDQLQVGVSEGFAAIFGSKRPVLRAKNKTVDLRPQKIKVRLGNLIARVDALEWISLEKAQARQGKLYAMGEEVREQMPSIPAKSDNDAILFTLSLIDED